MRRNFTLPLMLLALLAVGCSTPVERAYAVRSSFNMALKDANDAREVKMISDANFAMIVSFAEGTKPYLDELDRSALAGEPFHFENVYADTRTRVRTFLIQVLTAKQKKGSP